MSIVEIGSIVATVVVVGIIGIRWFKKDSKKSTFDPNKVPVDINHVGGSGGGDGNIERPSDDRNIDTRF